jgi:Asp-tRNA(Asn)/Glu-tRNA(Gln) amidotransferase A subunit family amidase
MTTNGRALSAARLAKSDSEVVKSLLSEGAVIIGKTNMSTNALYATHSKSKTVGHTYNAYNTDLSSGGSSGGSATAVSLNFAAAGLGTDTSASLRYPAVLGGCVSLRPTMGLISFEGISHLDETRDTAGAITRSVQDQAIMLDVLTGGKYSFSEKLRSDRLSGMRLGVIEELSFATTKTSGRGEKKIDPEIIAAFNQAVENLKKAGAEVITVSFGEVFTLSEKTFSSTAQSRKDALYEAFCDYLDQNGLDAAIFPTYLSSPLYISDLEANYINNCKIISPSCGVPEIALTIDYHSSGAGIGMEIVSKKNCEQLLLDIAHSYTEKFAPRRSPKGAPDEYLHQHEGTLTELFAAREAFLAETEEAAKEEASGEETKPDLTPYLVIGLLLLADVAVITFCVLLIIWYKRQ